MAERTFQFWGGGASFSSILKVAVDRIPSHQSADIFLFSHRLSISTKQSICYHSQDVTKAASRTKNKKEGKQRSS